MDFFFFKFKINCNVRASLICSMGRLHCVQGKVSVADVEEASKAVHRNGVGYRSAG